MTGSVYTAYGNTAGAQATPWQQYPGPGGAGIYIDVNTSFARFPGIPVYSTILRGNSGHWETTGVTSIYNATAKGFRVYVRRPDGRALTPQEARDNGWYVEWVGTYIIATPPVVTGSGTSRIADWQQYPGGAGVLVDVDTSDARFPKTPIYVCSLYGTSGHWDTTGGSSVYNATAQGFRVYVRRPDGRALTPQEARDNGWYIGWMGQSIETPEIG